MNFLWAADSYISYIASRDTNNLLSDEFIQPIPQERIDSLEDDYEDSEESEGEYKASNCSEQAPGNLQSVPDHSLLLNNDFHIANY
jgi:hypothetical protein